MKKQHATEHADNRASEHDTEDWDAMHPGGKPLTDAALPKGRRILGEAPEVPIGAQVNRAADDDLKRNTYKAGAPSSLSVGARRKPGDLDGMIPNMREGGERAYGGADSPEPHEKPDTDPVWED